MSPARTARFEATKSSRSSSNVEEPGYQRRAQQAIDAAAWVLLQLGGVVL